MGWYVVESYQYAIEHGGRDSEGAIGEPKGSEKIYLHVLSLTDREIAQLKPRLDEHGNKQHDRLALPRNEEWWIAVEGEISWPKIHRQKILSRCVQREDGGWQPAALSEEDLGRLRQVGVRGI